MEIEWMVADHQREILAPMLAKLEPVFPRWAEYVSIRYNPDLADIASVSAMPKYLRVHLHIGDAWFSEMPTEQEVTLAHEIAHAHVAPLANLMEDFLKAYTEDDSPERKWAKSTMEAAEEACVSGLSRCFKRVLG